MTNSLVLVRKKNNEVHQKLLLGHKVQWHEANEEATMNLGQMGDQSQD